MSNQSARQAASFVARKNRRSRQFISELPTWSAGLSVTQGELVQSNGAAWSADSTGITGTTAPSIGNTDAVSDGVITWTRQWRLLTGG